LGKTRIPGAVALLLRHCVKRGLKPWDVCAREALLIFAAV
jgi:hypothetical protein